MTTGEMDAERWWLEQFEASRPRLRAIAHRMLGSPAEADDALQETWLRLGRNDPDTIDNVGGWLTTVTSRVCLDRLRARRSRPEDPAGDAVANHAARHAEPGDPADALAVADSVGTAMHVVLDALAPAERVAFVLHDVFGVAFDEIAPILDKSSTAVRQLASRARRRVRGTPAATGGSDPARQRAVVEAFLRAAKGGDLAGLIRLLDPDVEFRPDEAALAMGSLQPVRGATGVAEMLSGGAKAAQVAIIDGLAGLVWAPGGHIRGLIAFTVADGRIVSLDVTGDVERIAASEVVILD